MPASSRIYGPLRPLEIVKGEQTGISKISVICIGSGNYPTKLKYGIGYKVPGVGRGRGTWHGWKNYTKDVPCNEVFEFKFEVTQEMWDKQKAGNALFVYVCDGAADRPISGVGNGRYSYFAVVQQGVTIIGGRVDVATGISGLHGRGGVRMYVDRYKYGRIFKRGYDYGFTKARPDGKVFQEGLAGFWGGGEVRFIRKSLWDDLYDDEKTWLLDKGVVPVPAGWSPAEGAPIPRYRTSGRLTVPAAVLIALIPGWGVELKSDTLPVTFDLSGVSCTDVFGNAVTPPNISGKLKVIISVNGTAPVSLTLSSSATTDLVETFDLWNTTLKSGDTSITISAHTEPTTIDGIFVPSIRVSGPIPLTSKICDEGKKRSPKTCWDGSTINEEICSGNAWVPSGETCPVMPGAGEKRSEYTCWDGSKIYAEIFDAVTWTWVPTGETCPVMPGAGATRGETTCWDGSKIYAEKFDAVTKTWIPTGATCPTEPPAGEKRGETTCWDGTVIYAEIFDAVTKTWIPTGATCPTEPPAGEKRGETTCWDGTVIYAEIFDAVTKTWIPTGATCPVMPGPGEVRGPTTCWDGSKIYAEKFDRTTDTWVPTGATCPTEPPAGEKRGETTCWDGTVIYAEKFDATTKRWVPTGETCPVKVCTEGDKRSQVICWDGSVIDTEICRDNAWVPSGEECPPRMPERVIRIAAPKIVYEGQAIDIVTQAFCGAALSSGEPATLTVDGVEVQTKNTSAGEVKFRWTAKGTGMRRVCVTIPANPKCPAAGSVCKTLTVSAYVAGIGEQIKAEKAAYEEELARLRELKRIERRPLSERAPGVVKIPASLAGVIVEIGGVPTTIPEGGMPIVVPPGENIVTIIREGVRTDVPVIVPPGGTIILPELPGGL